MLFYSKTQSLDMIDALKYLSDLKAKFLQEEIWKSIPLTSEWANGLPDKAGVYAFKEDNGIVYVGETGNIRERMKDMLDTRHHTLRRSIGAKYFAGHALYQPATSKKKYAAEIEELISRHMIINLTFAYLEVELGRKELEEAIEEDINEHLKLNKRGKRGLAKKRRKKTLSTRKDT